LVFRAIFCGIALAESTFKSATPAKEDTQMSFNSKATNLPQIRQFVDERPEFSETTRLALYTLLEEAPGLIFGLMTVVYIVTALWSLA
jgi:hypothetical protein